MIEQHDEVFPCARGSEQDFFVKVFRHANPKKHSVIMLHDLFDYHGVYVEFAKAIANLGHNVHLPDFRGFGRSAGARGQVDRHDELVDDIEGYIRSIPGQVILAGHGVGALVAIRLLHRQSLPPEKALKGLILSNPLLRFSRDLPDGARFILDRLKHPFDLMPLPWRLSAEDRSSNEIYATKVSEDPLVRDQVLLRTFREVEKLTKLEQNASYLIDVPTLTLLSSSDTIGSLTYAKLFTKAIDPELNTFKEYERRRRDLFNDVGYEEVYKDVVRWLEQHFS